MLHTAIITVVSVSIQFVLGMSLALVMHRTLVARGLVRAVALIPYGIVAVVAAYSWQLAWSLQSDPRVEVGGQAGLLEIRHCEVFPGWRAFSFLYPFLILSNLIRLAESPALIRHRPIERFVRE